MGHPGAPAQRGGVGVFGRVWEMGTRSLVLVLAGPCGTGWAMGQGTLPGTVGTLSGTRVLDTGACWR